MQSVETVFLHGWGFDAHFWDPLLQYLGWDSVYVPDFGFFEEHNGYSVYGQTIEKTLKKLQQKGNPILAVGHSLGFLWLIGRAVLPVGSQCVGFNAFGRFASGGEFTQGVPIRVLERMKRHVMSDPISVVNHFRKRCGASPIPLTSTPDVETLCWGLDVLREFNVYTELVSLGQRVTIVGGMQDVLVSPEMLKASIPSTVRVLWEEGGHLLPQTHIQPCATLLQTIRYAMA